MLKGVKNTVYRVRAEITAYIEVEAINQKEAKRLAKCAEGKMVKPPTEEFYVQEKTGHVGWHTAEKDSEYEDEIIKRLIGIYAALWRRCYNVHHEHWNLYGKQKIGICDEWLNDFYSFVEWSLENGYANHLTLDKIDNSKNYGPDNCRWATKQEQANNRKDTRHFIYNGRDMTTRQIADEVGVPRQLLINRICSGKSLEEAISMGRDSKERGR